MRNFFLAAVAACLVAAFCFGFGKFSLGMLAALCAFVWILSAARLRFPSAWPAVRRSVVMPFVWVWRHPKMTFVAGAACLPMLGLQGCQSISPSTGVLLTTALTVGEQMAPGLAFAACTALTKQAAHTAKCLSTAGTVITFGQALAASQ